MCPVSIAISPNARSYKQHAERRQPLPPDYPHTPRDYYRRLVCACCRGAWPCLAQRLDERYAAAELAAYWRHNPTAAAA